MFLLRIISSVILIFNFTFGLDPIDQCSDGYKEDFSCFFQQKYNDTSELDVKFCTLNGPLNNFTCLVNQPIEFGQNCLNNQTIVGYWQCYNEDLKPMTYSVEPNQTDFTFSEDDIFNVTIKYENSNPPPFSQLQFEQGSENETYSSKNETHEIYSFAIRNFGNYSLKIFQPAYQDYDKVLFHIEQGHYYLYSKSKNFMRLSQL